MCLQLCPNRPAMRGWRRKRKGGRRSLPERKQTSKQTFASFGVTSGKYVWTWGTTDDQSITLYTSNAAATLPAALPLFAGGLGELGLFGRR